MTDFPVHDIDSAPEEARPLLDASQSQFGMIPNLHGVMAASPQLLEAYQHLHEAFTKTALSTVEQNVVWLTINVENRCHYCVPAHTAIAHSMDVPREIVEALREERPLEDSRLEALRRFTLTVLRERGHVDEAALEAFLDAGFEQRHVLDVILGVSQKVMSNYLNHLAGTPVDAPFEKFAWRPADAA